MKKLPIRPKRRLSLQIIRIARELEALHIMGEATATRIHLAIGDLPPKPVCERTIYRDLNALEAAGFVERYRMTVKTRVNGYKKHDVCVWRLASPVMLRERLQLVKSLSNKQIEILRNKGTLADVSLADSLTEQREAS